MNVIYVFIDASNSWAAQKAKGKLFDYEKLRKYLKSKFDASTIGISMFWKLKKMFGGRY